MCISVIKKQQGWDLRLLFASWQGGVLCWCCYRVMLGTVTFGNAYWSHLLYCRQVCNTKGST